MNTPRHWQVLGVLLAIGVTSSMDATGLSMYSALPLAPLLGVFWYLEKLPRKDVGFVWGKRNYYLVAVSYPVIVAFAIMVLVWLARAIDTSRTNWKKAAINFVAISLSTILVAVLTEEGFFRGWLWASLEKTGMKPTTILVWSSIAFSIWHWSAVMLKTGFDPPRSQVPVFMVNAAVMGGIWGVLRWKSGSVIVSSLSHGIWNGMAYVLFGFGTKVGAFGVRKTGLFGPEVGVAGLTFNILFLIALLKWSASIPVEAEPAIND